MSRITVCVQCGRLHESESDIQSELRAIRKRLDDIEEGLGELEGAVEEFQDYSYSFNIKILGVPELSDREKAEDTSNLCVNLFNKMGAEVSIRDIDIAHSVFSRHFSYGAEANCLQVYSQTGKE